MLGVDTGNGRVRLMTTSLTKTEMKNESRTLRNHVNRQTKDMTMMLRDVWALSERMDRFNEGRRQHEERR